jgi:hypothetical protein
LKQYDKSQSCIFVTSVTKNDVEFVAEDIIFFCIFAAPDQGPSITKKNDDFMFCLFWYAQQQNPYNL